MATTRLTRFALTALVSLAAAAVPLSAQQSGFEVHYGRWWHDTSAVTFSAGFFQRMLGPFGYSMGLTHLDDHSALDDRTATGLDLGLSFAKDGSGPYAVATYGIGLLHSERRWDAIWTVGGGYAVRLFGVSLGVEARYRVEDASMAGFWRLHHDDRRGLAIQGRLAFALPTARRSAAPPRPEPLVPPRAELVHATARDAGASEETARLKTSVVQTAIEVMGTPYRWGGSAETGFDCSGLIQYAYSQHGIILPRVSRDQLRMGTPVEPDLALLRPGDLLGFRLDGSGVGHVALYIGDGQFIHSASDGVKISSLTSQQSDTRYWRERWISVRRIVE